MKFIDMYKLFTSDEQKALAETFIKELNDTNYFKAAVVTEISPLVVFYKAEEDHQNYYNENSDQRYCDFTITPKIEKIKKHFSDKLID